ncbi:MAG: NTP transferase domain-containing protein [Sphingomonadales bacterium]
MIFGWFPVAEAEGAILAHSMRIRGQRFNKGRVLDSGDIAALLQAGHDRVMAARLEPDDVPENEAADRVARALLGNGMAAKPAFTGRANLIAGVKGLVVIDHERLDQINLLHEALTVATVEPFALVEPGQIVATIKIIPFAAPDHAIAKAEEIAADGGPIISAAALKPRRAALILTSHQQPHDKVLEKTRASVVARLEALGCRLGGEKQCPHDEDAIAKAARACAAQGLSPILVFGSSAIVDRRDVIPTGIERAGGTIDHFGMPVDPGNLLLLAHIGATPVIGLPGCARSLSLNGFDWILRRVVAGLAISRTDIMRMGTGGLLKDFAGRPQPRQAKTRMVSARAPRIAALVLAAGQSRRMGAVNKLLQDIDGQPMLVRTVDGVLKSHAAPVVVVTGHQRDDIESALAGREVVFTHNPDYSAGLSTSLRAGIDALSSGIDGVVVCLGDMPYIRPEHIDKLIAAFDPAEGRAICVPTFRGKHGNPVLWSTGFFPAMKELIGDVGARHLIGENSDLLCEVAIDEPAIFTDIDTPQALSAVRQNITDPK